MIQSIRKRSLAGWAGRLLALAAFVLLGAVLLNLDLPAQGTGTGGTGNSGGPGACSASFVKVHGMWKFAFCDGGCGNHSCKKLTKKSDTGDPLYLYCGCQGVNGGDDIEPACCHVVLVINGDGSFFPAPSGDCVNCPGGGADTVCEVFPPDSDFAGAICRTQP